MKFQAKILFHVYGELGLRPWIRFWTWTDEDVTGRGVSVLWFSMTVETVFPEAHAKKAF